MPIPFQFNILGLDSSLVVFYDQQQNDATFNKLLAVQSSNDQITVKKVSNEYIQEQQLITINKSKVKNVLGSSSSLSN